MKRIAVSVFLVGCSAGAPAAQHPEPAPSSVVDAPPAPDAGVPQAVLDAPAWVFRYSTAQRNETWTLRFAGGVALLVVETAQGTTHYTGTAVEGSSIDVAVSTATATLTLQCKPATRPLSTQCNDAEAMQRDVLDCYHPDFAAPMPFGAAPGVEYVVDATCNGYRLAAPR